MSDSMRWYGQFTFNAWALDGFKKLFWYDLSATSIYREIYVLGLISIYLAIAARLMIRRWMAC